MSGIGQIMLTFSKRTDYALMALGHLVDRDVNELISAKEIADKHHIPGELLAKVLQLLAKAKIIVGVSGPSGGYRLAKPAESVSLSDVIFAVEGEQGICGCMKEGTPDCNHEETCTIREPMQKVNRDVLELLRNYKLTELTEFRRKTNECETTHLS